MGGGGVGADDGDALAGRIKTGVPPCRVKRLATKIVAPVELRCPRDGRRWVCRDDDPARYRSPDAVRNSQVWVSSSNRELITSPLGRATLVIPTACSSTETLWAALPSPRTMTSRLAAIGACVTESWRVSSCAVRSAPAGPPQSETLPAGRTRRPAFHNDAGCCARSRVPAWDPARSAHTESDC